MSVKFDERIPVYLQIIDYFKAKIISKEILAGEELPSRREVAQFFKVNPNTVQKAFKEMESLEIIYTNRNAPSIVTEDQDVLEGLRNDYLNQALDQFIQTVYPLEITLPRLKEKVEKRYLNYEEEIKERELDD